MKYVSIALLGLTALAGCGGDAANEASDGGSPDAEQMKAAYESVMNAFESGDPEGLEQWIAVDAVDHMMPPGMPQGVEGLKMMVTEMHNGYPDASMTIEDMVVSGDQLIARFSMTGTFTGEMMGMQPTNKPINITGVDWMRWENGKFVEHWGWMEEMKMMMQLGMMPDELMHHDMSPEGMMNHDGTHSDDDKLGSDDASDGKAGDEAVAEPAPEGDDNSE